MTSLLGYIIFKGQSEISYQGVDRPRVEPGLYENNIKRLKKNMLLWQTYVHTWEQKAFKLYEENALELDNEILMLQSKKKGLK